MTLVCTPTSTANPPPITNHMGDLLRILTDGAPGQMADVDSLIHADNPPLLVAYVELENFRQFGDLWGRHAADQALSVVETRLRWIHYAGHTVEVVHLSRDEFVVLSQRNGRSTLEQFGQLIVTTLREPFTLSGQEHQLSVHVGLTRSDRGSNFDSLLLEARLSLQTGRCGVPNVGRIYDRTAGPSAEIVRALPAALRSGEIRCAFQPTINTVTDEIVHLEALARWTRPSGQVIRPADFVPCAESFGLARELTQAVLYSVSALIEAPTTPANIRIWINITATELDAANFPAQLRDMLRDAQVPCERIGVEITESQAVRDPLRLAQYIRELQECGILVAIDDFGSGYSPLGYLRTLSPDIVKLDRSVISHIDSDVVNQRLVIGVIDLLLELDIGVIAEGVERIEEEEWLRANRVNHVQGYLRGIPADPKSLQLSGRTVNSSAGSPAQECAA